MVVREVGIAVHDLVGDVGVVNGNLDLVAVEVRGEEEEVSGSVGGVGSAFVIDPVDFGEEWSLESLVIGEDRSGFEVDELSNGSTDSDESNDDLVVSGQGSNSIFVVRVSSEVSNNKVDDGNVGREGVAAGALDLSVVNLIFRVFVLSWERNEGALNENTFVFIHVEDLEQDVHAVVVIEVGGGLSDVDIAGSIDVDGLGGAVSTNLRVSEDSDVSGVALQSASNNEAEVASVVTEDLKVVAEVNGSPGFVGLVQGVRDGVAGVLKADSDDSVSGGSLGG